MVKVQDHRLNVGGRPPLTDEDRWSRSAWMRSVLSVSGLIKPQLEARLGLHSKRSGRESKILYKFEKGIRPIPAALAERVAQEWPATRAWIDPPYWTVLRRHLSYSELLAALRQFPARVQRCLFRDEDPNFASGENLRRPIYMNVMVPRSLDRAGTDLAPATIFFVAVALMREAELCVDWMGHGSLFKDLERRQSCLKEDTVLCAMASQVWSRVVELHEKAKQQEPLRTMYAQVVPRDTSAADTEWSNQRRRDPGQSHAAGFSSR